MSFITFYIKFHQNYKHAMNKRFNYIAIFSFILVSALFSSCGRSGDKKINPEFSRYIAAFTYGKVSSTSSIQVELTQDIPNVELNKEIDQELFEISPSIKGKAYWTSSRNIKFVPDEGELKAGQEYDVWFKLGKILDVNSDFKEFYFYFKVPEQNFRISLLPYSPMKDNDLVWNTVQGTLTLADEANVDNINKMFSLSGGANTGKIRITPTAVKGQYNIAIDSLKREKIAVEYTLAINGSSIEAKHEETLSIPLNPIGGGFEVIDVRSVADPQECIRVTFSDPVSLNQNIQGLINPNGIENFSYDIQKNVLKIYLESYPTNSSINLQIYQALKSFENKALDRNYTFSVNFQKTAPEIKLSNSGNILPNSNNLVIPFQAVGLWAVDVKVIKIFENNILGYLQANDFGESSELKRFGRLIKKKRIRLDEDPTLRLNEWNDFSLDLSEMIKQDPGAVYRIEFSMQQEYSLYPENGVTPPIPTDAELSKFEILSEEEEAKWDNPGYYYYDDTDWSNYSWSERDDPTKPSYYMNKSSNCIVLASNIGLIAKLGEDKKVQVTTTDILTTKPMSGVNVDVYNYQMQRIGSGKTDGDGFATIEYKGGAPFVLIASHDKEKGYLKMASNLSLSLSNFDVSGSVLQKGMKGYIYGERGVWRPGDSIFVTFILEDKNNTTPKDHPVSLSLYTPRGQLYQQYTSTSGQNGFYAFRMKTDQDAITGNWQARIKVGGATFNKTLSIETVKPNRLKVRLNAGEVIDASKGSFTAGLSSQWLHGAAASNLKAKVEMTLSTSRVPFKGYEKYSFNNPASTFYTDTYTLFEGSLDASGNATVRANLPQAASAPGMLKANIVSRVFESGGDASINTQVVPYSPFSAYVGIKPPTENNNEWMETDTNNKLDIITLSPEGKPVSRSNLNVRIYKLRWSWWWNDDGDNLSSYVNSTSSEVVLAQTISTNSSGKGQVDFKIEYPEWGRYLVMVKDENSGHTAGRIVYVDWPSWRGRSNKQDPNGVTMLSFATDKQTYNVGETATVIIPKSSNGRALISIEDGSRVLSRNWVKTSPDEDTKYTFKVTEEMAPNFYIFATMLQPHAQTDNDLPIRMYGVLNINVENKDNKLNPVISMPDELRPEKEFTVSVSEKNKKNMTYTLAIVDDGLLDLTSFKTPNAWSDFYARQALGVRTWDMFDLVVGAQTGRLGPLLSIGGDEALKPSSNPVDRFKPVVKYLGPFTLKGGKTDNHKITLPPYFGSVRVMVVAGNEDAAYGNAEKTVKVKNPLMVLSTLPRVAGPDEEILLPVNVFAMDKKVKNVTVSVQSNGLFQFLDGTTKSVTFTEEGDKMVYFKVKVAKKTGAEKVVIKATGGGENVTETIDIEIRNPNPPVLLTSQALVNSKDTATLNIKMDDPRADDWVKLEVSRMPGINLSKNIAYLLDYPYGCSEQVTSKAFPLLYVGEFTSFSDKQKERMDYNVKEAIKIISSRQLSGGGIVYWPGNRYPTEWVTTYAGHFLIEAKRAGKEVPADVLSKWIAFQKKTAQNWNNRDAYNSYYEYSMSDLQQAYRLYTLALAEEPELGAMNRLKEKKDLTIQARWRLAAAYLLAGKKDAANQLLSGASDIIEGYSYNNNTYGSSDRDMAMIMETYLLMGKTDKALALGRKVAVGLSQDYISTQSASFGLIAMSKLAKQMGKGAVAYEWELNGVKQKSGSSGKVFEEIDIKPQENIHIKFLNRGDGELFVRLIGRTQPIEDKTPAQQNNVKLYVKYVNDDGREIDVTSLRQGTEFYANVIVQNISGQFITDLALNQVFASGWEIFNDRLFNASDDVNQPFNYQDIRDDRVQTFFNIGAGYSKSFRVKLQAAYCGKFYLPAATCEVMYKPEEQSRTTGCWVEVKQ